MPGIVWFGSASPPRPNIGRVHAELPLIVVDCLRADTVARPRRDWPEISAPPRRRGELRDCLHDLPDHEPAFTSMLHRPVPRRPRRAGAARRGSAENGAVRRRGAGERRLPHLGSRHRAAARLRRALPRLRETDYRDIPRRSVHSGWGDEAPAKVRELAAGDRPFFALVHVWDVHTPRKYPRSFDHRRYGHNAYERSLAGIDPGSAGCSRPPATHVVILTGDHGENLFLEPPGLRWQGLARRITPRLPIQKWSLRMLERGVAQRLQAAAQARAALLLEPQPDAARAARPRAARFRRPRRDDRRCAAESSATSTSRRRCSISPGSRSRSPAGRGRASPRASATAPSRRRIPSPWRSG